MSKRILKDGMLLRITSPMGSRVKPGDIVRLYNQRGNDFMFINVESKETSGYWWRCNILSCTENYLSNTTKDKLTKLLKEA